jgi:hypothetical protein
LSQNPLDYTDSNALNRGGLRNRHPVLHPGANARKLRTPSGFRVGIIETSAALGVCLIVLTVAVVLDRRPYRPGKLNYIPIMIIALAASSAGICCRCWHICDNVLYLIV